MAKMSGRWFISEHVVSTSLCIGLDVRTCFEILRQLIARLFTQRNGYFNVKTNNFSGPNCGVERKP